ncbi:MAG: putative metal-binding motif-containing protein [Polyangiaceae bacterium]
MRLLPRIAVLGVLAGSLVSAEAFAYSGGVSGPDCVGCHGSGDYSVNVTASGNLAPGGTVTLTLSVNASGASVLGTFIGVNAGSLGTIGGQGLATVPQGLSHISPKSMSSGSASFNFNFTAPSSPGAVRVDVSTLAGNGNGKSSGDQGKRSFFDFVYGCSPATYYRDLDGDGYGQTDKTIVHCAGSPPTGYASEPGDCNDSAEKIYPGAVETCNQVDDDCNGEIDDDAIPVELYPDADGDGYYSVDEYLSGDMIMGCVPTPGYAAEPGDCRPDDPEVNPGQEEICNLIDDNCDNRVDERVRPRCGTGWCEAEASTCDPDSCFPGDPREEVCNLFDDDCDGLVDDDAPCEAGLTCIAGECREATGGLPDGSVEPSDSSGCSLGVDSSSGDGWLLGGYLMLGFYWLRRRRR